MKLLLTSMGIVGVRENGVKIDAYLSPDNDFINNVKRLITSLEKFVFIASDKDECEHNDVSCRLNVQAFEKEGITFKESIVVDSRNSDDIESIISGAGVIFLQGGDVYIENQFFKEMHLKDVLIKTGAIDEALIIGQSAGSMNLGSTIYIFPDDDAKSDDYPKYVDGMSLAKTNIIPHFNVETGNNFAPLGVDLLNDYFIPDSFTMPVIAILDGTYILVTDKNETIYGEAYKIENGMITKICDDNKSKIII